MNQAVVGIIPGNGTPVAESIDTLADGTSIAGAIDSLGDTLLVAENIHAGPRDGDRVC